MSEFSLQADNLQTAPALVEQSVRPTRQCKLAASQKSAQQHGLYIRHHMEPSTGRPTLSNQLSETVELHV